MMGCSKRLRRMSHLATHPQSCLARNRRLVAKNLMIIWSAALTKSKSSKFYQLAFSKSSASFDGLSENSSIELWEIECLAISCSSRKVYTRGGQPLIRAPKKWKRWTCDPMRWYSSRSCKRSKIRQSWSGSPMALSRSTSLTVASWSRTRPTLLLASMNGNPFRIVTAKATLSMHHSFRSRMQIKTLSSSSLSSPKIVLRRHGYTITRQATI